MAAPPEPNAAERAPYRLLIVDDEPGVLSALRRCFGREKYDIVTLGDPVEALQRLRQESFHVIISDFKMPGLNGGELLKQARSLQPSSMRIMLTGHADVDAVVSAVKAGAVYKFILKPWNDEDLRVTVALALEQHELLERNRQLEHETQRKTRDIEQLVKLTSGTRSQLAIVLNKKGLLSAAQVQELFRLQQRERRPALCIAVEQGWLEEAKVRQMLARDFLFQEVALADLRLEPALLSLLPARFCQQQWVLPLRLESKRLQVAMLDPLDSALLEELRFVTGLEIQPVLCEMAALQRQLESAYGISAAGLSDLSAQVDLRDPFDAIEVVIEDEEQASLTDLLQSSEEPPAIRLVNAILLEAIRLGASDIHIQPRAKHVVVRLRIDGVLVDKIHIPSTYLPSLVSRLKVMSELDIAERRHPQDGRITVRTPRRMVDMRISTLPTINGEKVVLRILDRNAAVVSLEALGLAPPELAQLKRAVSRPQGILLATGPTGSGKTTTLYSLLHHQATPDKSFVTIEDPVEYYLDSAGQVMVKERIGLKFSSVLRAILRQDPDVILLGEIRDPETATVAFQAALSGHQVLSTLHTNSAADTITRLLDLELKPFVVASALGAVIAQRLVRRLCSHCRAPDPQAQEWRLRLGGRCADMSAPAQIGLGCEHCHGLGFAGRLGLYEVLSMSPRLRQIVQEGLGRRALDSYLQDSGHRTLHDDACDKVAQGVTSLAEVFRVLGPCET